MGRSGDWREGWGGGTEFKFDSQVKEEEHFDNLTHHTPAQKSHRSEKGPLSEWTTNQLDEMSTALHILTPTWEVGHITSNSGARKPHWHQVFHDISAWFSGSQKVERFHMPVNG